MLQHIIRHSFAEREAGSWLPTETAQTRNRSQQLSPEKAECPLPRTESVARRSPQHSQGTEPTPPRGERCVTGGWQWRYADAVHSRMSADGKISTLCVPKRPAMTKCSRNAFPSVRRWQDCALMRSWPDRQRQYTCAVRSRGSCRGKIPPRCVPGRHSVASFALHASRKWPRAGKSPVPGKIRTPCIRNELALARYARHASEMPREPPLEDTPREDLARKGPFSLHGPLESRTARESCHRSAHERKGSGRKCLRFVKTEPKRQKMSPKVLTSF